jgi:hypothetical protein
LKRKQTVELMARAICRDRQIDPDRLAFNGELERCGDLHFIPSELHPAWTFFRWEAEAALNAILNEQGEELARLVDE